MENPARDTLFQQAVDDHMGILLKTAHGFAGNAADRDDLVQEFLLALWLALPGYGGQCRLSTFVYRVVHNRALNWQRTRSRYHRKLELFSHHPQLALDSGEADAQQQKLAWLYALIRTLPPLDRTLLMLQLDGLAHREIAEVTGLTDTNVGVRLHRIKQWLTGQKPDSSDEL
jgi:RNA polymerase sigma factor (sigma-70 family)